MSDILNSRVLVLNSSYVPINITSLKKAFSKIIKSVAEIVTVEDGHYMSYNFSSWAEISELKRDFEELGTYDDLIGVGGFSFIVPRIIRVLNYDRFFRHPVKLSRKNVLGRDKQICQYCGKKFPSESLTLDHVMPRCQGGQSIWENLVCACIKCNTRKSGRTPEQAKMKLLKSPVRPATPPNLRVTIGDKKYKDWETFLSEIYWNVDIEEK